MKLKSAFDQAFEGMDFKPLAKDVRDFAKAFDPATDSGKQIRVVVRSAFDIISKSIKFAHDHMDQFIVIANVAIKVLEILAKTTAFIFKTGEFLGRGVARIATGDVFTNKTAKNEAKATADQASIDAMNKQIEELQAKTAEKVEKNTELESAMRKVGIDSGSGLMEGLANSLNPTLAQNAGNNLAQGVMDGFSNNADFGKVIDEEIIKVWDSKTQSHSPSKLFEIRGGWLGQGLIAVLKNTQHLKCLDLVQISGLLLGALLDLGQRPLVTFRLLVAQEEEIKYQYLLPIISEKFQQIRLKLNRIMRVKNWQFAMVSCRRLRKLLSNKGDLWSPYSHFGQMYYQKAFIYPMGQS